MEQEKQLTPMMMQYKSIKSKYPNEVLFFRLGDFYEMFDEDAVEVSRLLNLTLTHRSTSKMCGIPYHAAKVYIARLLRLGKKIVICEQVEETIGGKGIAERKVTEVITPGTAVESEYLEGNVNNYLASFCVTKKGCAFAFIDVTTSSFRATSFSAGTIAENFPKELGRCSPREMLLPQSLKSNQVIQSALEEYPELSVSWYPDWDFNPEYSYKKLLSQFGTANLKSFNLSEESPEVVPAGFLLDYLEKTTNSKVPHINGIKVYEDEQYLIIDDSSRRNLEIVNNLRDGTKNYSLLECLDHSRTAMGSRLIRKWLLYPLTDVNKIRNRSSCVEVFVKDITLQEEIRSVLSNVLDVERLAGRIAMDRAHAKDLQALKSSLQGFLKVREKLSQRGFGSVGEENALKIINLIENSILDDPSTSLTDGGIIKSHWSEELDHWRGVHDNFDSILRDYEEEERQNTGISTLKIKYNNAAGYFIEISRGKLNAVPSHFIMRRALVNGDRYTTVRLQELEQELNHSGSRILELERDLFIQVRNTLHDFVPYLLDAADEIAFADAVSSFAYTAGLYNWVKPEIQENGIIQIEGGRHPVVELHIPAGEFVPNNLELSADEKSRKSFALITGPNMAGKSTFLRQNALIVLLAQIGSYVPASKAVIGAVDRIFCRVGASDNLAKGESTFLVEMSETAKILRSATEKSLVIMDEVGRGTSTEDGLSIAWAVSEYLLDEIKCRTLFATHYHELTRLENEALKLLCMAVSEESGAVVFLRKVIEGATENSYGLHVAKLAGVPEEVISRANEILSSIQSSAENKIDITSIPEKTEERKPVLQSPGLFSDEEIILDEILSCNIDEMTPINALQTISRWKKALSGR